MDKFIEVPVQDQPSININQLRIKNELKPIPNGDADFITIQGVPVQEQHKVIVGFDEVMLNATLERINQLKKELQQEINSLPSTIKIQGYQNPLMSH